MQKLFIAVEDREGNEFGIKIPDLPGVIGTAKTFSEIPERAKEAIQNYMASNGAPTFMMIRGLDQLMKLEEFKGVCWTCLDVANRHGQNNLFKKAQAA